MQPFRTRKTWFLAHESASGVPEVKPPSLRMALTWLCSQTRSRTSAPKRGSQPRRQGAGRQAGTNRPAFHGRSLSQAAFPPNGANVALLPDKEPCLGSQTCFAGTRTRSRWPGRHQPPSLPWEIAGGFAGRPLRAAPAPGQPRSGKSMANQWQISSKSVANQWQIGYYCVSPGIT